MALPFVRPSVAELVFRLFDRPLHPELFDAVAERRVERENYRLAVHITPAGHTLSWSNGRVHIVEVTATADQDLPAHGGGSGTRSAASGAGGATWCRGCGTK